MTEMIENRLSLVRDGREDMARTDFERHYLGRENEVSQNGGGEAQRTHGKASFSSYCPGVALLRDPGQAIRISNTQCLGFPYTNMHTHGCRSVCSLLPGPVPQTQSLCEVNQFLRSSPNNKGFHCRLPYFSLWSWEKYLNVAGFQYPQL